MHTFERTSQEEGIANTKVRQELTWGIEKIRGRIWKTCEVIGNSYKEEHILHGKKVGDS